MPTLNMRERFELFAKVGAFGDLEDMMLQESNLSFLVLEQLEDSDVEKLRTSIKSTLDIVNKVGSQIGDKFPSLAAYLEKNKNSLAKAEQLASKIDLDNPEGLSGFLGKMFGGKMDIGRALQGVLEIESKANQSLSTFQNALGLISRNLKGKIPEETSLSEIPEDVGITSDQLKTGVKKAFGQASKKGIFAKMAGFFKKKAADIPGAEDPGEFPVDAFADELLQLTMGDLQTIVDAAGKINIPKPNQSAIEDVNKAAQAAQTSGNPLAGTESEDAGGNKEDKKDGESTSVKKSDMIKNAEAAAGKAGGLVVSKLIDQGAFKDSGIQVTEESFYRRNLLDLLFEQTKISSDVFQSAVTAASKENEADFKDVDLSDLRDKLNGMENPDLEIEAAKINPKDLKDENYRQAKFIVTMGGKEIAKGNPSEVVSIVGNELTKNKDMQADFGKSAEIEVSGGGGLKVPFSEMEDLVSRVNSDLEAGKYGETGFRIGEEAPAGTGEDEEPEKGSLSSQLFTQIDPEDSSKGFEIAKGKQGMALKNFRDGFVGSPSELLKKPNSQNRKAFIKNLNQLVGKEMFEATQERRLIEESSDVMNRWRKLAGIKDES